jgi:hypothetical protein
MLVFSTQLCKLLPPSPVLRIRIRMFLGILDSDPDPLFRDMDPDHSIIKQK